MRLGNGVLCMDGHATRGSHRADNPAVAELAAGFSARCGRISQRESLTDAYTDDFCLFSIRLVSVTFRCHDCG